MSTNDSAQAGKLLSSIRRSESAAKSAEVAAWKRHQERCEKLLAGVSPVVRKLIETHREAEASQTVRAAPQPDATDLERSRCLGILISLKRAAQKEADDALKRSGNDEENEDVLIHEQAAAVLGAACWRITNGETPEQAPPRSARHRPIPPQRTRTHDRRSRDRSQCGREAVMADEPISEAFCEVLALAESLGVSRINELPGCWEHQLDEHWRIAVNGHNAPTKCSTGPDVPAFHVYVEFNGWPAGMFSPHGGTIAAGEAANEDTFTAALRAAKGSRR